MREGEQLYCRELPGVQLLGCLEHAEIRDIGVR